MFDDTKNHGITIDFFYLYDNIYAGLRYVVIR
jgi:hypothetical protein